MASRGGVPRGRRSVQKRGRRDSEFSGKVTMSRGVSGFLTGELSHFNLDNARISAVPLRTVNEAISNEFKQIIPSERLCIEGR